MQQESILWYKQPADLKNWNDALPVGNGRLGAMIFGGISNERIQMNEDSVWSGGYRDRINPYAKNELENIRTLLREEKFEEAENLARYALSGTPEFQRVYQTLGDIEVSFQNIPENITQYKRTLSLDTAVSTTTFSAGGYLYEREVFASFPADVIAIKLKTTNPDGLSFDTRLMRNRFCETTGVLNDNSIYLTGTNGDKDGISFHWIMTAQNTGGKIKTIGEYLVFKNVNEAILYTTAATSFRENNTLQKCTDILNKLENCEYEKIKSEHINDYQALEKRVSFMLDNAQSEVPTDERLKAVQNGRSDPGLQALYFRFGRYLLISCSRPGTLPANLQGVWCNDFIPPWDSKYTININIEMNYWPAEICNLSECHIPLFDHIKRMHPKGTETAKKMYGVRGFVAHHNTDIWGDCAPQDTCISASYWVLGAAWFCLHIWEHYEYTQDKAFLNEHYYLIKDACLFFIDFMTENKKGELVLSPTVSPENIFRTDEGKNGILCEGCTMDAQLLYELFTAYENICKILDFDHEQAEQIKNMKAKLPPTKIGKNGGIAEWLVQREEPEPGHRHMSHLFALYPGNEITPEKTPDLADAAKKTLELRLSHGGGHTGWSRAWIINFWARLGDAREAYFHLDELLRHSTLPNLFDNHPPFQIDGNFGATAAIINMLVQSTPDTIYLLKALPEQWQNGSITGLCLKGGLTVDISWANGKLKKARIFAKNDYTGKIVYGNSTEQISLTKNQEYVYGSGE